MNPPNNPDLPYIIIGIKETQIMELTFQIKMMNAKIEELTKQLQDIAQPNNTVVE